MANRLMGSASAPPQKKARRGHTKTTVTAKSKACHLHLLDCGMETGIAFKKSIALFAGIQYGPDYKLMRKAEKNLELFGY